MSTTMDYQVVRPSRWQEPPPATLLAETPATRRLAVQPALFSPDATYASVAADLRSLGGDASVPLVDRGDGIWTLNVEMQTGSSGLHRISVMIDQDTFLGSRWIQLLSQPIAVLPAVDLPLLGGIGWSVETANGAESPDFAALDPVESSRTTTAFEVAPASFLGWNVVLQPAAPIDPFGYTHLRLAFHPGDAMGRTFSLIVDGQNGSRNLSLVGTRAQEGLSVDLALAEWQVVEIPLDEMGVVEPITSIAFNGDLEGVFYLDDVTLVAGIPGSSTAVAEENGTALPASFSLYQNYPNPFNAGTIIRFALPTSDYVDLSLYNLAGQQVATLVAGQRTAGVYTVRWDGRDDGGRELGSGLYLYRLRAGAQVETRKLLLVR